MASYSNDPRWIVTKFHGRCTREGCRRDIPKTSRAFYYPLTKALLCEEHGAEAERDFEAHKADEEAEGRGHHD